MFNRIVLYSWNKYYIKWDKFGERAENKTAFAINSGANYSIHTFYVYIRWIFLKLKIMLGFINNPFHAYMLSSQKQYLNFIPHIYIDTDICKKNTPVIYWIGLKMYIYKTIQLNSM